MPTSKWALILMAQEKVLTWEGMSWARAFKTDCSQGALPTYPSEFLLPGDIVFTFINYVDRKATKNQPARTDEVITLTQLPDVESASLIASQIHVLVLYELWLAVLTTRSQSLIVLLSFYVRLALTSSHSFTHQRLLMVSPLTQ